MGPPSGSALASVSDLDALTTAAALSDQEEPHDPTSTPPSGRESCANCGARLKGRYCADCGQLDQPLRIPVHRFLIQSFTEFFGIDGRVWTTLGSLLFKPGKLTAEFLTGRRRRYLRPLRVYLSTTLLFFVLLALLDPVGRVRAEMMAGVGAEADSLVLVAEHLSEVERQIADEPARIERAQREADSLRARLDSLVRVATPGGAGLAGVTADSVGALVAAQVADSTYEAVFEDLVDDIEDAAEDVDTARDRVRERTAEWELEAALLRALPSDSTVRLGDIHAARAQIYPDNNADINLPDWMVRSESVRRLQSARTDMDAADALTTFARDSVAKVPTVLFLILPVFALLLKLLYVRRGWYYSEHLVFGLHTHAFAFMVFTAVALLAAFGGGAGWSVEETPGGGTSAAFGWLSNLLLLSLPVYFVVALKRVYGQGWVKTVLKSVVLGSVYNVVLIAGLVVAFLLAAALG